MALAVAAPAAAHAARPTLSMDSAEVGATRYVTRTVAENNTEAAADRQSAEDTAAEFGITIEQADSDPLLAITDSSMDGCDRESTYRALCDATFTYADATTCDVVLNVVITRRGRLAIHETADEDC